MIFLLVKSLHIVSMVAWFAGIFYLPRLFVYHADATDATSNARFKVMERRLLWSIMTPAGILTLASGAYLLSVRADLMQQPWLQAKLVLVGLLLIYHGLCVHYWHAFLHDRNDRGARWYRVFNELPVLLLVGIVLLVELQGQLI